MSDERAFPNTGNPTWGMEPELGITVRDYFAAQAIAAMIMKAPDQAVDDVCTGLRAGGPMAYGAYSIADAMIHQRALVRT